MVHYHVWFDLKPGIVEREGVALIKSFLAEQRTAKKIATYRLLKNTATPPKSVLAAYDAHIEFVDQAQFTSTFDELRQIGIHTDPHGAVIEIVTNFSADVFQELPD